MLAVPAANYLLSCAGGRAPNASGCLPSPRMGKGERKAPPKRHRSLEKPAGFGREKAGPKFAYGGCGGNHVYI